MERIVGIKWPVVKYFPWGFRVISVYLRTDGERTADTDVRSCARVVGKAIMVYRRSEEADETRRRATELEVEAEAEAEGSDNVEMAHELSLSVERCYWGLRVTGRGLLMQGSLHVWAPKFAWPQTSVFLWNSKLPPQVKQRLNPTSAAGGSLRPQARLGQVDKSGRDMFVAKK